FDAASTDSGSTAHGYVYMVASTTNPGIGLKNLTSGNVWLWSARNFGPLQLYRESASLPGLVVMEISPTGEIGVNVRATSTARFKVGGSVEATGSFVGSFSGAVVAGNVSSDVFGRLQGNGNFAFPASVGVATSSKDGLPQSLSVYGNAYVSGSVGIGTTGPGAKLDVAGTLLADTTITVGSADSIQFIADSTAANDTAIVAYLSLRRNNIEKGWLGFGSSGDTDLTIYNGISGGDIILTGAGSNNVGIGTTSPELKLDVNGDVKLGNRRIVTGTRDIGAAMNDWVEIGTINHGAGIDVDITITGHWTGNLFSHRFKMSATFYPGGASTNWVELPMIEGSDYNGVQTMAVDAQYVSNGNYKLRVRKIGGSANAGGFTFILRYDNGTFTASSASGSTGVVAAGYRGQPGWKFPAVADKFAATTEGLFITSGGNVGIGTTAPAGTLTVKANTNGWEGGLRLIRNGGTDYWDVHPEDTATALYFGFNGGAKMIIEGTTGNVGIGTTDPQAALDVGSGGIRLGGVTRTTWPAGVDAPIYETSIYGANGDLPWRTTATAPQTMRYVYGPFSYAMPSCASGYSRQHRLYAEFVDSITTGGQKVYVRIYFDDGAFRDFDIGATWGGAPSYRTTLSGLFAESNTNHAYIQAWINGVSGPYLEIRKLEIWTYCI
ncbi:MAG: hypothetical protein UY32_C0003G0001, partial [Candidatus Jorgensenbacteria bacterium GW2011_GWC1_48_8]